MSQAFQRRYPRVRLQRNRAEVIRALGGQVIWPNLEASDIVDLSLKGCAVRRPAQQPVSVNQMLQLDFELGLEPAFTAQARVAWLSVDRVGLSIEEQSARGRLILESYLGAKLLGSSLRPVRHAHHADGEDFNHWLQGPRDTHVFVWLDSVGRVERVRVSHDGSVFEIPRGGRFIKPSEGQRQALLLLSHMDKSELPMEEFVRSFEGDF